MNGAICPGIDTILPITHLIQTVLLDLGRQCLTVDLQYVGSLLTYPTGPRKDELNVSLLHPFQRQLLIPIAIRKIKRTSPPGDADRKMTFSDGIGFFQYKYLLHHMPKLPDITRPGIATRRIQGIFRKALNLTVMGSVIVVDKMAQKQGNIF